MSSSSFSLPEPIGELTSAGCDLGNVGESIVEPITSSGRFSSTRLADIALVGRAIRRDRRIVGGGGAVVALNGIRVGPIDNG